jgi:phosphoribosylglycinamide formyltransferase-1
VYFPGPFTLEGYSSILHPPDRTNPVVRAGKTAISSASWVALSGWLKKVEGLDPKRTFNIHPALLSFDHGRFGGPGFYGHRVHDAVALAFEKGEITESGFSMHFVTDEYDRGPVFFEKRISLSKGMTVDEIARAVNVAEHEWQPKITSLVVNGEIAWDGKTPSSLVVPEGYAFLPENKITN